ncbi:recombinase family protein [Priestia koreensis]|uniref:recombinase family protein n=1 Tax=Priestia koreensis TaxID=284581 RepID=UPI002041CCA6|nr:recombinase family protein [Priestia koreensis]MCM3003657.1 recombinase family protein [Priestia koreensis]
MKILKGNEKLALSKLKDFMLNIQVIIYARVSTSEQAIKGYSLESQLTICKERAMNKYGISEKQILAFCEHGGGGADPNRPGLKYMINCLEKGIGKKVIILHPDRLARDNTLQGVLSNKIWELGVDLDFVEVEVDPDNPESMLMYNIQGSIAQYNRSKIVANSKRGRIQKIKKGEVPGIKRLYGYTFNKETDQLEINEFEKNVFLDMVDMLLNKGISCTQIAKQLSKRGVPAPSGTVWYQATISRMFKNLDYVGIMYQGKTKVIYQDGKKKQVPTNEEEWIKISIPPIIDLATHNQILQRLKELKKKQGGRPSSGFLLYGLLKCGRCGGSVGSGAYSRTKQGVLKYYVCCRKKGRGYKVGSGHINTSCQGANWRMDVVDNLVWNWLLELIKEPYSIISDMANGVDDVSISTLYAKRKYLEDLIEVKRKEESRYIYLFGQDRISIEQFDSLVLPIRKHLNELNNDLKSIGLDIEEKKLTSANSQELAKKYMTTYQSRLQGDNLTKEMKQRIMRTFIEKVTLHDNNTIEISVK